MKIMLLFIFITLFAAKIEERLNDEVDFKIDYTLNVQNIRQQEKYQNIEEIKEIKFSKKIFITIEEGLFK